MYQGLILFYVGAVLILNGLHMLDHIGDREIPIINIFVGLLSFLVAIKLALGADANFDSIRIAAFSLLFAFTYLWVAFNQISLSDGRGLGWFSLFVSLSAIAIGTEGLYAAASAWSYWAALSWLAWAGLWGIFFAISVCKQDWKRQAGYIAVAQGILTGWLPGYLLLTGRI